MLQGMRAGTGGVVAIAALFTLVGIVAIGAVSLPSGAYKAQIVASIVTADFGVIGAIVGAYFRVSSSTEARREAERRLAEQHGGPTTDETRS
jgi:hypothetical protein